MHEIVSCAEINGTKFAACGESDPVDISVAVIHSKSRLPKMLHPTTPQPNQLKYTATHTATSNIPITRKRRLTPRLNAATQMPVARPRRQPMSSSAHSGGAPSPSSSSSPASGLSHCRCDGCSASTGRSSCW